MRKITNKEELNTKTLYLFDNGEEQVQFRVQSIDPEINIIILPEQIESFILKDEIENGFISAFEETYLIDLNSEYNAGVYSVLREGKSIYCGKTKEELQTENPKCNFIVINTWEEVVEKHIRPYLKSLQKDWEEITEEEFDNMLNALPPCRWTTFAGGQYFYISEAYTHDLHSFYVKIEGKFYTALRSRFIPHNEIMKQIENI